jgi:hypothetical protein
LTRSVTSFWSRGYGGTAVATANKRETAGIESTLPPETGPRNAQRKATLYAWRFCRGCDPPGTVETRNRSSPMRTGYRFNRRDTRPHPTECQAKTNLPPAWRHRATRRPSGRGGGNSRAVGEPRRSLR